MKKGEEIVYHILVDYKTLALFGQTKISHISTNQSWGYTNLKRNKTRKSKNERLGTGLRGFAAFVMLPT